MVLNKGLCISILLVFSELLLGQQLILGENPVNRNTSALLEMATNNKGFLLPRLTTLQRNIIKTPVRGFMIYNKDLKSIEHYDGTSWETSTLYGEDGILSQDRVLDLDGKSLRFRNFTTDNAFVVSNVSGDPVLNIDAHSSRLGIGTDSPSEALDVVGGLKTSENLFSDTFSTLWSATKTYRIDDVVLHNGRFYRNTTNDNTTAPDDSSAVDWQTSSGQMLTIYTGDNKLSGDRQIDLDGNGLGIINAETSDAFKINNGLKNVFHVDAANRRVGINQSNPQETLDVEGNVAIEGTLKVQKDIVVDNYINNGVFHTRWVDASVVGVTAYKIKSLVLHQGRFYYNLTGKNTDTPPPQDSTNWALVDKENSIYTNDGTLTANRTVDLDAKTIEFENATSVDAFELLSFKIDGSNNRVGIQNTSPKEALDVNGQIKITEDLQLGKSLVISDDKALYSRSFNTDFDPNSIHNLSEVVIDQGKFYKNISSNQSSLSPSSDQDNWGATQNTIWNTNGSLNSNRIIDFNNKTLSFVNNDDFKINTDLVFVDGVQKSVGFGTNRNITQGLFVGGNMSVSGDVSASNFYTSWTSGHSYKQNDVVIHNGMFYANVTGKNTASPDTAGTLDWTHAIGEDRNIFNTDGILSSTRTLDLDSHSLSLTNASGSKAILFTNKKLDTLFLVDADNKRVGIGKENPQATLDVKGNVAISDALYTSNFYTDWQSSRVYKTNDIVLYKGKFYKNISGSNNSQPDFANTTDWSTKTTFDKTIYNTDGTLTSDREIDLNSKSVKFYDINAIGSNSTYNQLLMNNGTEDAFSIDIKRSRVGIGKANPSSALDVEGDISLTGNLRGKSNLILKGDLKTKNFYTKWELNQKYNLNDIVLDEGVFYRCILAGNSTAVDSTRFPIWEAFVDKAVYSANGILSNNRTVDLDDKTLSFSNLNKQNAFSIGQDLFLLDASNGYVGIGTSTPLRNLDVKENIKISGHIYDKNDEHGTPNQLLTSKGNLGVDWQDQQNIYNNDATITSDRVIDNLTYELRINGRVANAFSVDGNTFVVDALNNRVGIGTSSPESELDVLGNVKLSGDLYSGYFSTDWSASRTYNPNDVVLYNGAFYKNIKGGNLLLTPSTDTDNWTKNSQSIYNIDGVLDADRIVNLENATLSFTNTDKVNAFSVGGDAFSVDAKNNRVGVSTSLPKYGLDVEGSLRIRSDLVDQLDAEGTENQVVMRGANGVEWSHIDNTILTISNNLTYEQGDLLIFPMTFDYKGLVSDQANYDYGDLSAEIYRASKKGNFGDEFMENLEDMLPVSSEKPLHSVVELKGGMSLDVTKKYVITEDTPLGASDPTNYKNRNYLGHVYTVNANFSTDPTDLKTNVQQFVPFNNSYPFPGVVGDPIVQTIDNEASDISYDNATLRGKIEYDGGADIDQRLIQYSTNPDFSASGLLSASTPSSDPDGTYTVNVTTLKENTRYYYRAYVRNLDGNFSVGVLRSFTTLVNKPVVETIHPPINVSGTTATLSGAVLLEGTSPVIERGLIYSTTNNININSGNKLISTLTTNVFQLDVMNLTPNNNYFYVAYATNAQGTSYGAIREFASGTNPILSINTVTSNKGIDQTADNISISGKSINDNILTERGALYSLSDLSNLNISDVDNLPASVNKMTFSDTTGSFNVNTSVVEYGQPVYIMLYGKIGTSSTEFSTMVTHNHYVEPSDTNVLTLEQTSSSVSRLILKLSFQSYNDGGFTINRGLVYSRDPIPNNIDVNQLPVGIENLDLNSRALGKIRNISLPVVDDNIDVSNLKSQTKYYFKVFIENDRGVKLYDADSFETNLSIAPFVKTVAPEDNLIQVEEAQLKADIVNDFGIDIIKRGVIINTTSNFTTGIEVESTDTSSAFLTQVNVLQANTKYYFKAFAENVDNVRGYGDELSFTTKTDIPIIETNPLANSVTIQRAKLFARIIKEGSSPLLSKGFLYSTNNNFNINNGLKAEYTGTDDDFDVDLNGLNPNTTYYFRAYATNTSGVAYGEIYTFKTLDEPNVLINSITTNGVINQQSGSITIALTSAYKNIITNRGVLYSLSPINETTITDINNLPTGVELLLDTSTNDTYSLDTKTLLFGQEVHFIPFNLIQGEIYWGLQQIHQHINTPANTNQYTLKNIEILYDRVTLDIQISTYDDGGKTLDRGLLLSVAPISNNIDANSLPTNVQLVQFASNTRDLGLVSTISLPIEENKLVVKNLNEQTLYYIKFYVRNEKGTTVYGNETITTLKLENPKVLTKDPDPTKINPRDAYFEGNITSNGGALISEVGFEYNQTQGFVLGTGFRESITDIKNNVDSNNNFSKTIALESYVTYYFRAYAKNTSGLIGYGEEKSFTTTSTLPLVDTNEIPTLVGLNTATLGGRLIHAGATAVTEKGIEYSIDINFPTSSTQNISSNSLLDDFTVQLNGLSVNTTYYYKAYADNSAGRAYGAIESFKTDALPTVSITGLQTENNASSLIKNSIKADVSILSPFANTTERGLLYSTTSFIMTTASDLNSLPANVKIKRNTDSFDKTTGQNSISFITDLVDLGQNVFLMAYTLSNDNRIVYSSIYTHKHITPPASSNTISMTLKTTTLNTVDLTLRFSTYYDGGETTERGILVSDASIPAQIDITNMANYPNIIKKSLGSPSFKIIDPNNFSPNLLYDFQLTQLAENTDYNCVVYIHNSRGTTFYPITGFRTILASSPTLTLSSIDDTDVTDTAVSYQGTIVSDGGVSLKTTAIEVSSKSDFSDILLTNPLVIDQNNNFSGTFSVVGLLKNQVYYVRASAENNRNLKGYSATVTFRTKTDIPEVSTNNPPAISDTTVEVNLSGVILDSGTSSVSEVGILYSAVTDNFDVNTGIKVVGVLSTPNFTSRIKNLLPKTKYYYRAYALNSTGYGYGAIKEFTTGTPVELNVISITSNSNPNSDMGGPLLVETSLNLTNNFTKRGLLYSLSEFNKSDISDIDNLPTDILSIITVDKDENRSFLLPITNYGNVVYAMAFVVIDGVTYLSNVSNKEHYTKPASGTMLNVVSTEVSSTKIDLIEIEFSNYNDGGRTENRGLIYSTDDIFGIVNLEPLPSNVFRINTGSRPLSEIDLSARYTDNNITLQNLIQGTTYNIRGFVQNDLGVEFIDSNVPSFKTKAETMNYFPISLFQSGTDIITFLTSYKINPTDNSPFTGVKDIGYDFSTTSTFDPNTTFREQVTVPSYSGGFASLIIALNKKVSDFTLNTVYYSRAYIVDDNGTHYSPKVRSFMVKSLTDVELF